MATERGHFHLHAEGLPDDVVLARFETLEKISTPFTVTVAFSTSDHGFVVDDLMRKQATLEIVDARHGQRFFDGVVDRAEMIDVVSKRVHFRIRIRPALAALAHRENSRIFQEKTVIQIAQEIFDEAGFGGSVEWLATKDYQPREFVVQYRESELNFITRLFEDHGLFYWFAHSTDGHKLFIADVNEAFAPKDDTPVTVFAMSQGTVGADPLEAFRRRRATRTTQVTLRDYNFEKPQVPPEGQVPAADAYPAPYFEYGAGFVAGPLGQQFADARMRALRTDADVVTGKSGAIGLRCACPFTVEGAREPELNGAFVVTELATVGSQHDGDPNVACDNTFVGIPAGQPYAPPMRARRPRIHGMQTAIVTGSSAQAQALHVDEFGRIKVRFYWDRVGQQNDTSSCWIRVSQVGLGGSMILPRIGWEVAVAFIDGDPNRPLVLGRVYNAEKTPPYALPGADATASLKSWSTPGEGGFNEVSMADNAGSMGMNWHAQKDLNITIGHDKNETVAVDEKHHVSVNESMSVGSDESTEIGADQTLSVGANLTQNITGNQAIAVGGNDESNATCDFVEKIDANRAYTVGGDQTTIQNGVRHSITGDLSKSVGSLQINATIAPMQENVSGDYTHETGAVTVHLVAGEHGETVGGNKELTSIAAELHMSKANIEQTAGGMVTNLVGGLHYQKLDGDLVIKAPTVAMIGATGSFKGGGSELKLGGGPIVAKGSKITVDTLLVVKMGSSLKLG